MKLCIIFLSLAFISCSHMEQVNGSRTTASQTNEPIFIKDRNKQIDVELYIDKGRGVSAVPPRFEFIYYDAGYKKGETTSLIHAHELLTNKCVELAGDPKFNTDKKYKSGYIDIVEDKRAIGKRRENNRFIRALCVLE